MKIRSAGAGGGGGVYRYVPLEIKRYGFQAIYSGIGSSNHNKSI